VCEKRKNGNAPSGTIDPCMRERIDHIKNSDFSFRTLSCCCGHGRYPETIVIQHKGGRILEGYSRKTIPRKRRFYRRDNDGFYYIPEVSSKR